MTATVSQSQHEWKVRSVDLGAVQSLADLLTCPVPIATLLWSRGIVDRESVTRFFHPSLDDLHDPLLMLGMEKAVSRIQQAIENSEPILIYGDYDVDGTTAIVLLKTAIERIASKDQPAMVSYHVPHRIREGYGMQTGILADAAASGIRLVISVDTGIRAFTAAKDAAELGLDLIVTDHHLPDEALGLPKAVAVINPSQPDCTYPNKYLCGAAVAFKLAHALLLHAARLASDPTAEQIRIRNKLLPSFLKLVAIATIADSVPLVGENRVIVSLGLRELRNPVQPGLRALMEVAAVPPDRSPTVTEVGFRMAPRINAAGRMDVASDVVELFLTKDSVRARILARKLDELNESRRATEAKALVEIDNHLHTMGGGREELVGECIVLDAPDWHRGVLGILASRIVDRTGCPALVITHENGIAHGSGRSVPGFHLLDALTSVQRGYDQDSAPVFTRFGGHAHAVGFTLPSANLSLLRRRMKHHTTAVFSSSLPATYLMSDAVLHLGQINPEFMTWLQRCAPHGINHPEPLFAEYNLHISGPIRVIQNKHVSFALRDAGQITANAVGWSHKTDWLMRCKELGLDAGSQIDILYRPKERSNPRFPGIDLELVDLRIAARQDG